MHYRKFKLYGDPLGRAVRNYELVCIAEGCDRSRIGGPWCSKHYQRVRSHGDANAVKYHRTVPLGECVVEDCKKRPAHGNGMCEAHMGRLRKHGDASIGRSRGRSVARTGYVVLSGVTDHPLAGGHGQILEHRFVMAAMLDRPLLRHESVHHLNGDRTDNRPENLELWSSTQPSGQRVADKVKWAREVLALYGDLVPPPEERNPHDVNGRERPVLTGRRRPRDR